jgi:hypothetical protein
MEDYIPVRCRLFVRRADDAEGVKRCMVGGVLLSDMGLEMDQEEIWDGAVLILVDKRVDVRSRLRGTRLDQAVTSSVFSDPENGTLYGF